MPRYKVGDVVRVTDDLAEVAKLQKNHGGWVEDMSTVSSSYTNNHIVHLSPCNEKNNQKNNNLHV